MDIPVGSAEMRTNGMGVLLVLWGVCASGQDVLLETLPPGWTVESPRKEIAPNFEFNLKAGPSGQGVFSIFADHRSGSMGWFQKSFPVEGGQYYQFSALQRTHNLKHDRRTAVTRILWRDAAGNRVKHDFVSNATYARGRQPTAEPEFPPIVKSLDQGWKLVTGIYLVPSSARQAVVELSYRWAAGGRVEWSQVKLTQAKPLKTRKVKLATVHYRPVGGETNLEKCALFKPLIAKAAKQQANIIVLPECLTYYGRGRSYSDCAEAVPGETTDYFVTLAKKYNIYICAGLLERDGRLIYNTAALVGPEGFVGKYRKVSLPRGEIEAGITPGQEYPVFETAFGKVGMMICYDGFFPEVARQLSQNGAEIICWPVWGCNPLLGAARACENHVFVVSSTYCGVELDWMITGVYGRDGKVLAQANHFGDVVSYEVDLSRPLIWSSLGDFKAQLPSHTPIVPE
ncbi:MAG: carbon-nitrogen hydrolase family protein [Planctomycetota bacterium]|nr:carbon-nitrogen hydrolase family protein [Planctomycetota bacterium]